jgi:hypothetical protein
MALSRGLPAPNKPPVNNALALGEHLPVGMKKSLHIQGKCTSMFRLVEGSGQQLLRDRLGITRGTRPLLLVAFVSFLDRSEMHFSSYTTMTGK